MFPSQERNALPVSPTKKNAQMELIADGLAIRLLASGGLGIKNVPPRTVPMLPIKLVINRSVAPRRPVRIAHAGLAVNLLLNGFPLLIGVRV